MIEQSSQYKKYPDAPPRSPEELYEEYKRKVNGNANK
jgi:hypothetical protein